MGFESLFGNEQLKTNLSRSLAGGHISHFYLISGPAGSGKHTLAKLLAAAILCRGTGKPCGVCGPCRKLAENNHPDFITVEDPEHKNVAVKTVRAIREDMFIRPNESDYKIYLFPQELGLEGQNALLKILEEPPSYGVFLMLTDNPQKLLPTVRSRCTQLALAPLEEKTLVSALEKEFPKAGREEILAAARRSGGFLGQAKTILAEGSQLPPQTAEFLAAYTARDGLGLTRVLTPMDKMKRDQLIPLLESWRALLEEALAYRCGMPTGNTALQTLGTQRSPGELAAGLAALQKATEYARGNVSPGAICGWLSWELR